MTESVDSPIDEGCNGLGRLGGAAGYDIESRRCSRGLGSWQVLGGPGRFLALPKTLNSPLRGGRPGGLRS